MNNTNTCKHNWQYVDALGYWEDDYYIFVEDIYFLSSVQNLPTRSSGNSRRTHKRV